MTTLDRSETMAIRVVAVAAVLLTVLVAVGSLAQAAGIVRGRMPPLLLLAALLWVVALAGIRREAVFPLVVRTGVERALATARWAAAVTDRLPRWAVPLALTAAVVAVWFVLDAANPYIGHDEAVYASRARSWVSELPASGWQDYRPPGLPVLGVPVIAAGLGLAGLRVLGLLFVLLTLVVVYVVAEGWSGRRRAAVAAAVVLSGEGFQRRIPEYLNDILAAGMLLALAALLVRVRRGGHPAQLVVAAVVAVGTFYVRYGALSGIGAVVLAAVLIYGPRAWLRDGAWLAAATGVGLAGLLPHLVWSQTATASPFGVLEAAADQVAGNVPHGYGLVWYAMAFPQRLAGDLGAVVMLAGFAYSASVVARQRRDRWGAAAGRDERWVVVLAVAAGVQVLALGLTTHGEARFVLFAVLALTVVGVHGLAVLPGGYGPAVLGLVVVLAVVAVPGTMRVERRELATITASRAEIVEVGAALKDGHPCVVVTRYRPQLGWYSGCEDMGFTTAARSLPADVPVHLVRFAGEPERPNDTRIAAIVGGRPATMRTFPGGGELGSAHVVTLQPIPR